MASADVHEDKSEQARNHMPPLHELEAAEFRSCRVWPDAGSKDQRSEQTISPSGKKLDVLIAAEMTLPPRKGVAEKPIRLLFVIENKIKAAEEPDQTLSYAAWATDPARDKDLQLFRAASEGKLHRALLFLYWPTNPDKPERGRAKSDDFRNLIYQDLVDEVLGPCEKHPNLTDQGGVLVREYLHNLAHQDEDQTARIAV